mgnify:CR=1 FL=1
MTTAADAEQSESEPRQSGTHLPDCDELRAALRPERSPTRPPRHPRGSEPTRTAVLRRRRVHPDRADDRPMRGSGPRSVRGPGVAWSRGRPGTVRSRTPAVRWRSGSGGPPRPSKPPPPRPPSPPRHGSPPRPGSSNRPPRRAARQHRARKTRREPIESIRSKAAVLEHHEERLIDVPELVSQVGVQRQRRIGGEVRSDFSREIGRQLLRRLRRGSDDAIGEPEEEDDLPQDRSPRRAARQSQRRCASKGFGTQTGLVPTVIGYTSANL